MREIAFGSNQNFIPFQQFLMPDRKINKMALLNKKGLPMPTFFFTISFSNHPPFCFFTQ
jgi:phosphoglycerol transferase MdoB-like AlkP superfamily enzyme